MNIILSILKRFWRESLIIILFLIVLGSVRKCSENKSDVDLLTLKADSITYYQNKQKEWVGQAVTYEGTIDQLKKFGDQLGFDNKDLKKQVGNLNRLVSHSRVSASTGGTADQVILRDTIIVSGDPEDKDTVNVKAFEWHNPYMSIDGVISLDSNQLSLRYQYDIDFEITAYHKPMGLFKKSQLVTDIKFNDPSMRIQEFKGYVVTPPKKRFYQTGLFKFSLGVGAGAGLAYMILK